MDIIKSMEKRKRRKIDERNEGMDVERENKRIEEKVERMIELRMCEKIKDDKIKLRWERFLEIEKRWEVER